MEPFNHIGKNHMIYLNILFFSIRKRIDSNIQRKTKTHYLIALI